MNNIQSLLYGINAWVNGSNISEVLASRVVFHAYNELTALGNTGELRQEYYMEDESGKWLIKFILDERKEIGFSLRGCSKEENGPIEVHVINGATRVYCRSVVDYNDEMLHSVDKSQYAYENESTGEKFPYWWNNRLRERKEERKTA